MGVAADDMSYLIGKTFKYSKAAIIDRVDLCLRPSALANTYNYFGTITKELYRSILQ